MLVIILTSAIKRLLRDSLNLTRIKNVPETCEYPILGSFSFYIDTASNDITVDYSEAMQPSLSKHQTLNRTCLQLIHTSYIYAYYMHTLTSVKAPCISKYRQHLQHYYKMLQILLKTAHDVSNITPLQAKAAKYC